MPRRAFLRLAGAALGLVLLPTRRALARQPIWRQGSVGHILPTASHDEFLIKVSFAKALESPPRLDIEGRRHDAMRSDTAGRFWRFRISDLEPGRRYRLTLLDGSDGGKRLCDPWELATLPAPDSQPDRARVLFFSCAGGDERVGFLPTALRSRMLRRALALAPDVAVANGDHVYQDLRPQRRQRRTALPQSVANRTLPVLGSDSEAFVIRSGDRQIVSVYGAEFRSTPVFFVQDDHDYFDNDEATEQLVTFPPDPFMAEMARVTQHLFYPEFLPDPQRPAALPDTVAGVDGRRISQSFGTLRFGRLLEALLYSTRRTMTLDGDRAVFVADDVEQWLLARMAATDASHLVNVPSAPFGWTAGKWGEWYPDRIDGEGRRTIRPGKAFWQKGWVRQHDRLLTAMSAMRRRLPLVISGDLHASALGRITRTGARSLAANPVIVALCGAIGTNPSGWPSRSRGLAPVPSLHIEMQERLKPIERHGFSIVDFTEAATVIHFFIWDQSTQAPEEIDSLEPVHSEIFLRPN